jgi:hypothetical protein
MLFREVVAIYSENQVKPIKTLCGQRIDLFNVKASGKQSNYGYWSIK